MSVKRSWGIASASLVDGAEENGVVVVVVGVTVEEEAEVVTAAVAQAAAAPVAAEVEGASVAFEDLERSEAMRSFSCELRESGNASSRCRWYGRKAERERRPSFYFLMVNYDG